MNNGLIFLFLPQLINLVPLINALFYLWILLHLITPCCYLDFWSTKCILQKSLKNEFIIIVLYTTKHVTRSDKDISNSRHNCNTVYIYLFANLSLNWNVIFGNTIILEFNPPYLIVELKHTLKKNFALVVKIIYS